MVRMLVPFTNDKTFVFLNLYLKNPIDTELVYHLTLEYSFCNYTSKLCLGKE